MKMTSAVIVVKNALFELEFIDKYPPISIDDQIIIVKDNIGHYIGFIMQNDLNTLWLVNIGEIAKRFLVTYDEKGKLYSDDPDKDCIEVVLEYAMIY